MFLLKIPSKYTDVIYGQPARQISFTVQNPNKTTDAPYSMHFALLLSTQLKGVYTLVLCARCKSL